MQQVLVSMAERQCEWLTDNPRQETVECVSNWDNRFFAFKLQAIEGAASLHPHMAFLAARQLCVEMLECFSARLCGGMQAGYAIPFWLLECDNKDLKTCVNILLSGGALGNSGGTGAESLMDGVLQVSTKLGLPETEVRTVFTTVLNHFANPDVGREDNSIKHANRAVSAG